MQVKVALLPKDSISSENFDEDYTDITKAISRSGFPKVFSQSIKGEAYHDFSVKGFSFRVIKDKFNETMNGVSYSEETDMSIKMKRHDAILIMDQGTNEVIGRGFVDEIENWNDTLPRIKYMPDATRLKDIKAGVKTSDDDDEEEIWEFEIETPTNILDIILSLTNSVNETIAESENKLSKPFSAGANTIPQPSQDTGDKRYLGTVLHKRKNTGFSFNLAKMFIDMFDGSYLHRVTNGSAPSGYDWNYEVADAGVIKRILINAGQWLQINEGQWMSWTFTMISGIHLSTVSFSFNYPCGVYLTWNSVGLNWCTANFNLGHLDPTLEWATITWTVPSSTIAVPSSNVYIPCIGSRHDMYSLSSGDMVHTESYVKSIFPIVDSNYHVADTDGDEEGGDQEISSITSVYGPKFDNSGASGNITQARLKSFLKDEGTNWQSSRTAFDWDENNTYIIVKTKKRWNDIGGSEWLLIFETPFDFYQRLHYKNATPAKVLRDLAVVTDRYVFVNENNEISLKERDFEYSGLNVDRKWFISRKVKMKRDQETEIRVDRYKRDSDGKVTDFGIVLREAEWEYLQSFYKDKFSGNVTTNTLEILKSTELDQSGGAMPSLMDMLHMDDNGSLTKLGTVIQVDIGLEHSKYKYIAQFVNAGDA